MNLKILILCFGFILTSCYLNSNNDNGDDSCFETLINTKISPPPYTFDKNITNNYLVIELENPSDAKCLDGSPYKFLFQNGSGSGSRKFMFFFKGGGYCSYENKEFFDSCYERTNKSEGTSKIYGNSGDIYLVNSSLSYFSSDEIINPLFSNWNKVMLPYCDGTLFQGYRKEAVPFLDSTNKTYNLWFRGYNNTKSTLDYLKKYMGLFDAEEIILSGASSGAQATFIWMPYIRKYLPARIKLSGISDAGLFLDVQNQNNGCFLFRRAMKKIANFTNSYHLDLFENCPFRKNISEFWKCMVPEYILEFIDERYLLLNSQNDFEILRGSYGLHCLDYGLSNCESNVSENISSFRQHFIRWVMGIKEKKPDWGFWLRKCMEHYYVKSTAWSDLYVFSANTLKFANLKEAVYEWYLNEKGPIYIDLHDWNKDCPYIKNKNNS